MISLREVVASLYGAWRLARLDRGGIGYFDATPAGFWRSFYAAVPSVALDLTASVLLYAAALPDDVVHFGLALLLAYVFRWLLWPLVAVYLVQALDRSEALLLYLTAHNWAQVPIAAFRLIAITLASGYFPEAVQGVAYLSFLVVLAYEGFIARATLRIDRMVAVGIVIAYFGVNILVTQIGTYLAR